jgi:hypothetical protein
MSSEAVSRVHQQPEAEGSFAGSPSLERGLTKLEALLTSQVGDAEGFERGFAFPLIPPRLFLPLNWVVSLKGHKNRL